ncbi:tetratricopeptide repeat protein [Helicovermis profundi]|uniref:Tetratricopeptide repeat protein n=1 Tax=Helicovermis profundi TaxID=3065157 RepID=A0AAU9E2G9_9FIRM|nr:tetratricopeptide repeat protein [Clostridia bacterium S502]
MSKEFEKFLLKKTNEVVFIELKENKTVEFNGVVIDSKTPLPVLLTNIVGKVNEVSISDFKTNDFIDGMAYIIGIDNEFIHKSKYIDLLLAIDKEIWKKFLSKSLFLANNGNKIDAIIYLRVANVLKKGNIDILYNYSRILEEMSNDSSFDDNEKNIFLDESFNSFKEFINEFPDYPFGYYHLGFHYYNKKNYAIASEMWKKSITLNINEDKRDELIERINDIDAKVKYEEGYNLVINGMHEEGLVKLLPLENDYSDWWNLMFFIGLAYRGLENYSKALKYYFKVLDLNTGSIETYNEVGLCLMAEEKYLEAEKYFKEAQKMHIDSSDIWCNLGIVYFKQNKLDLAKEYINKAFELNPDDEVTLAWKSHIESMN